MDNIEMSNEEKVNRETTRKEYEQTVERKMRMFDTAKDNRGQIANHELLKKEENIEK